MNGAAAGGEPPAPPFAETLRRLIGATGPISIARFMAEANAHYYAGRDPLGMQGDFVTAPEVSQMFGELIGVWLADVWLRAGKPAPVRFVELGPGRGTLARDALGTMRRFGLEPAVHFVEAGVVLRERQRMLHAHATWHEDVGSLSDDGALLVVANEFFDALPVRQLVRTPAGWRERMVGLEQGRLTPVAGALPMDAAAPPFAADAPVGAIVETSPASAAIVAELARRLARQGGAALLIDYGAAAPRLGSSLQAVRGHARADPFETAGDADLTAHVDFVALGEVAQAHGAAWHGTIPQGTLLRALGIDARAARLAAAAPARADEIEAARVRLTAPEAMGALFKAMAITAPNWPRGAGF